ncbi:hypothetical protein Celaphus_00013450, partial [Cervus elaphus hippelaphus]
MYDAFSSMKNYKPSDPEVSFILAQGNYGTRAPLNTATGVGENGSLVMFGGALVDTGTSSLCGPRSMVTNIHSLIGATIMTLPPLTFTINGIDYPVPTQTYIQKEPLGYCWVEGSPDRPGWRLHVSSLRFQVNTDLMDEPETWILGDVFLRLYFSVFDQENGRIGLAPS